MKKIVGFIEIVILPFVALVCVVLDFGDMFNLFNFLPTNYIPMLTLLLVALVLISLTPSHHRVNELSTEIRTFIREYEQISLSNIHTRMSPDLRKVLGDDFFNELLIPLQNALNEHTVHFSGEDDFQRYYCSTLQSYPLEIFISSVTLKTYFLWQDTVIRNASANFIKNGGRIQQIFFMKHKDDLSTPEIQDFFAFQKSIGIDMSIVPLSSSINRTDMLSLDRKFLIVGSKGNIVWEVFLDDTGKVEQSVLITDITKVSYYRRALKRAYKYRKDIISFINKI